MEVKLRNLTKQFPSKNRKGEVVTAVDNFNIDIPDGKLIGLLGPSGCGKSTVLNLISGLLPPTEGQVLFGDEDMTNVPPEKRGVGLVFQNYALYPHLTVLKNILFPLQNLKGKDKLTKEQMLEKAEAAMRLVQIGDYRNRKPGELSGGQQQRVAIARALVKMPQVLLLDEPLSNLDARLRLQTREEIKKVQNTTGITTIFVTHDQEEAMSISDMIIVMKDGSLRQYGHPQEVYDDPNSLFVAKFLGTPPINVFNGAVRGGMLYLADDPVLPVPGVADADVFVGIRPEGFLPDAEGPMKCALRSIEVLGRDTSVVSAHPAAQTETIRSIVSAKNRSGLVSDEVRFSLDPEKVFLFRTDNEERIRVNPAVKEEA
ncbi:MAG: ABC transporter ATP-binding protein [Clostridia bacterium]|nr:ABC transporter ATP-binding protein [Clostridia bacterium]